jgi:hypothetical protein
VPRHGRALEAVGKGVSRALAQAGVWAATVTGLGEATALETTAAAEGWGPVTGQRQITATRGTGHDLEVTVSGGQVLLLIEARPQIPWAAQGVPLQAHAVRSRRALVTQARTPRAGHARRHTGVLARGLWAGVDR